MVGRGVGRVIKTQDDNFNVGDWVKGHLGWQQYALLPGRDIEKIEPGDFPPSMFLGALGSPGITAWIGLREVAKVVKGETVVISAATGAVGSVAAALARISGCRVVGIAGGAKKCEFAVSQLGYDAC